jgi:hypothetical protein
MGLSIHYSGTMKDAEGIIQGRCIRLVKVHSSFKARETLGQLKSKRR